MTATCCIMAGFRGERDATVCSSLRLTLSSSFDGLRRLEPVISDDSAEDECGVTDAIELFKTVFKLLLVLITEATGVLVVCDDEDITGCIDDLTNSSVN